MSGKDRKNVFDEMEGRVVSLYPRGNFIANRTMGFGITGITQVFGSWGHFFKTCYTFGQCKTKCRFRA